MGNPVAGMRRGACGNGMGSEGEAGASGSGRMGRSEGGRIILYPKKVYQEEATTRDIPGVKQYSQ